MPTFPSAKGLLIEVDALDFDWACQFRWGILRNTSPSGNVYARRNQTINGVKKDILLHREILSRMGVFILPYPINEVDHKNGNGLDNRRDNLRVSTKRQNQANRKNYRGTSRFKGVSRNRDKWEAGIQLDGKDVHLGTFNTEIDAARAYDCNALRYFGEFACVNFPIDDILTLSINNRAVAVIAAL